MAATGFQKYYQAPIPAIIAVLVVFVWQGLGHFVMHQMQHAWFPNNVFTAAFIMGVIGVMMVWYGRDKSENAATLLGFVGGSIIWLSWIEFSFVYVAQDLDVEAVRWGAKDTLPEYRVMLSSIGVLLGTLIFFFFNRETRCNAFMWLHRNLGLKPGDKTSGQARNLASIVAMETIYVTWFFYIVLLIVYNPAFFGTDHWATFVVCGLSFIWAAYLVQRLWWFQRMAPALRYAIPTAIIGWNVMEILEKWGHLDEIWVQPEKYALQIGIAIGAFVLTIVLAILSPARRIVDRPDNRPANDAA
ncbi:MAG TPA: hypothetical protein P5528_12330 [Steroidobacteraceae bacterium]|nr:hypothetical protein [Steroidobacteraceae bacterium]HRX90221.1 hypothetical protein [Steroidobacteraceae bacterium]